MGFQTLSHCVLTPAPSVRLIVRVAFPELELIGPTDYYPYTVTSGEEDALDPREHFRKMAVGVQAGELGHAMVFALSALFTYVLSRVWYEEARNGDFRLRAVRGWSAVSWMFAGMMSTIMVQVYLGGALFERVVPVRALVHWWTVPLWVTVLSFFSAGVTGEAMRVGAWGANVPAVRWGAFLFAVMASLVEWALWARTPLGVAFTSAGEDSVARGARVREANVAGPVSGFAEVGAQTFAWLRGRIPAAGELFRRAERFATGVGMAASAAGLARPN